MKLKDFLKSVWFPIVFVFVIITLVGVFRTFIESLPSLMQFLLLGLPLTVVILFYFGRLHDGWKFVASLILITYAWDLVQFPYMVSFDGQLSTQPMLYGTSIDYLIGSLFSGIGFNGILLYYLTYGISFALLFLGAVLISGKKKVIGVKQ